MDDPAYRDIPADALPTVNLNDEGFIKVIAGTGIADRPGPVVRDDIELVFLDINLAPHSRLKQTLPAGHAAFAYVADGQVEFGCGSFNSPATLGERELAVFDDGSFVTAITNESPARFLLIAGKPIGEPIVREGPFVMNTKAEIAMAIRDYQRGALA
jgi:redox-sensitive bicupin YhaK (pirin superfamily)